MRNTMQSVLCRLIIVRNHANGRYNLYPARYGLHWDFTRSRAKFHCPISVSSPPRLVSSPSRPFQLHSFYSKNIPLSIVLHWGFLSVNTLYMWHPCTTFLVLLKCLRLHSWYSTARRDTCVEPTSFCPSDQRRHNFGQTFDVSLTSLRKSYLRVLLTSGQCRKTNSKLADSCQRWPNVRMLPGIGPCSIQTIQFFD